MEDSFADIGCQQIQAQDAGGVRNIDAVLFSEGVQRGKPATPLSSWCLPRLKNEKANYMRKLANGNFP